MEAQLQELCRKLGREVHNEELLEQALRHPSYAHENPDTGAHYQRLEFLGDAVIGLIVADALFCRYPDEREGQLTRWRASLVSEESLADVAREIGLGDLLLLGKGEESQGGRSRASLLSDSLEATVGAVFLDSDLDGARAVVLELMGSRIDSCPQARTVDYKSRLQERVQSSGVTELDYIVVATSGPDHDKRFDVELRLNSGECFGRGAGASKKAAEQAAARDALDRFAAQGDEL